MKAEKFLPMVKLSALLNCIFVLENENAMLSSQENDESIFKIYLDRQGRNEFVNLFSQIGYDDKNVYENQIRKLMEIQVIVMTASLRH